MSSIDYNEKIPNNVNLGEDRALKRALEHWQPNYLNWWQDMGPEGSQDFDVYLRTATSVDADHNGVPGPSRLVAQRHTFIERPQHMNARKRRKRPTS